MERTKEVQRVCKEKKEKVAHPTKGKAQPSGVMPDSHLGRKRDIFYLNNKNNQLKRRVWPPRDIH